MAEFQDFLAGFVRRFGGQSALGKAIDVSPSRINKVLKGAHTLDIANCLKLAEAAGESPSVILRAAGKGEVADLIERLYGKGRPAAPPSMTPAQRELISTWEALPSDVRKPFEVLLNYARDIAVETDEQGPAPAPGRPRRRRQATPRRARATRTE